MTNNEQTAICVN